MAAWDDVLTGVDREVYEAFLQYRPRKELGKRPAVLIIDVNYAWVGLKPEPVLDSIKTFLTSCGEAGWQAIPHIQDLLSVARDTGIPVMYSTVADSQVSVTGWASRVRDPQGPRLLEDEELEKQRLGQTIVKEIEPQPRDIVLRKRAASVFNGTPLLSHLNEMNIDTLLVAGTSTSGCVHATAVDAACANFYVGIVEECTFDRLEISHKSALLNMHLKYGVVMSLGETMEYLKTGAEATVPAKTLPVS